VQEAMEEVLSTKEELLLAQDKDKPAKKKKVKPGSFQGLGLSTAMHKAIMKMGYKMPTPIQRKTIPTILEGQDMVAMARTGSGKTAAFLIPICERLDAHSVAVGVRAVVLSPTRELAMQTAKFFRQLSRFKGLKCTLLVGGQAMETQFEHLASNPDVVVATPGRLMHHMLEADLSLSRLEMLVFDEADRLFELGFAEQLQKILDSVPTSRQVMLFSATLPEQLLSFTRSGIRNPAVVRLDVDTTLSDQLELWFLYTRKDEKLAAAVSVLRRLHENGKSTVMFVATKHHVEFFGDLLQQLGLTVAIVYGSMDQEAREEQVHRFRKKKAGILVTTDVAARGIDIPLLDHVFNYDYPPSAKLFVHRSGRTARAGRGGLSIW
jgi:ATP-dependent RNA helicase DDX54/DBP10